MSQQALAEFFKSLPDNPDLADRLRMAVSENHGAAATAAVARIASAAGYDVQPSDAETFRAKVLEAVQDSELDDESLMEVAGGFFGIDDVMFLGLGATAIAGVAMAGVAGATGGAMIGGGAVAGAAMIVSGDVRKGVADFFSKW